jgi:hypothetical protein
MTITPSLGQQGVDSLTEPHLRAMSLACRSALSSAPN